VTIREIEYLLFAVSVLSLVVSLLLLFDGARDTVVQDMHDGGRGAVIANGNLRAVCYRFLVKILFLYVAVSFLTNPVPSPLPAGTMERVVGFLLGAVVLLLNSLDAYVTKRRLLRSTITP